MRKVTEGYLSRGTGILILSLQGAATSACHQLQGDPAQSGKADPKAGARVPPCVLLRTTVSLPAEMLSPAMDWPKGTRG